MAILLAFAPFIVFAIVDRLLGTTVGLAAGALASLVLVARDAIAAHRSVKLLEIGTAMLFCGLALYALVGAPDWSIVAVRLRVDAGLLAIVLATLVIGQPFTLQYAREQAPREVWDSPAFVRTNVVISAVWAIAFAVMVVADLLMLFEPEIPLRVGIIVTVVAIVGAVKFTGWYVDRQRAAAAPL